MRRFETIKSILNLSVEKDNFNNTYAVFIKSDKFKQQISKTYVKFGWAYKALKKQLKKIRIYYEGVNQND